MPIIRTPVAHKFGIISQTQKVELEKRIATKAYNETRRKLEAQNISELRFVIDDIRKLSHIMCL